MSITLKTLGYTPHHGGEVLVTPKVYMSNGSETDWRKDSLRESLTS